MKVDYGIAGAAPNPRALPQASSPRSIVVVGAGYVGLVTAAGLASLGHRVRCIESDPARLDTIAEGMLPIYEPGLEPLVAAQRKVGRLTFSGFDPGAVTKADAIFLAIGTPSRPGSDEVDLSFVLTAVRELAPHLAEGVVVVIKSTVPVGTNDNVTDLLRDLRPWLGFSVVSNPEFLREGCALQDFLHPDRLVVGHRDEQGREVMQTVYQPFTDRSTPVLFTSPVDAEMIKYAANAFLAMKVAFINEVADLCESAGGGWRAVAAGIGLDRRIGPHFLQAGPGFGGSCFPKDTRGFAATGRRFDCRQRLVEAVVESNAMRKRGLIERVRQAAGPLKGRAVAVLGVAFKPDTDDVRESPALDLIAALAEDGAEVRYYDPRVDHGAAPELRRATPSSSLDEALANTDAAVLLTDWEEIRALVPSRARRLMRGRVFIDLRDVLSAEEMAQAGFDYFAVGNGHAPFGWRRQQTASAAAELPARSALLGMG